MVRVRRIGVVSAANLVALVYLIIGLIFMVPVALVILAGVNVQSGSRELEGIGTGAAVASLIFFPLFIAATGWVFTALACLIYNLAAGMTGGVQLELREDRPATPAPPPTWAQPPAG